MKHGDLQRIAALDPLTNCYNRRFGLTRLREGDVLVRYSGEEFLCILPGATIEGAAEVCERIRNAIEAMAVQDRGQIISRTVSLGFGRFPLHRPRTKRP